MTALDFQHEPLYTALGLQTAANSNSKPTVMYRPMPDATVRVGHTALIFPVDHWNAALVSNSVVARTSKVVSYDKATGDFETLNTRYTLCKPGVH